MLYPEHRKLTNREIIQAILDMHLSEGEKSTFKVKLKYLKTIKYLKTNYRGMTSKLVKDHFHQLPSLAKQYHGLEKYDDLLDYIQSNSLIRLVTVVNKRKFTLVDNLPSSFWHITRNIIREMFTEMTAKKKASDKETVYKKRLQDSMKKFVDNDEISSVEKVIFDARKGFFKPEVNRILDKLKVKEETREIIFLKSEAKMTYGEIAEELNPELQCEREIKKVATKFRARLFEVRRRWENYFGTRYLPIFYN